MWAFFALGSAIFAALTSIFAKIGIKGINSHLATAIRTSIVLVLSWGMVFLLGKQNAIADITRRSWVFLILSGIATGISWLCFYKALQMSDVSKVIAIDKMSVAIAMLLSFLILHEQFTLKSIIGALLICLGVLFMI